MIEFLLLIISITLLYILLPVIAIFVFCRRILTGDWNYAKVWFYATAKEIDIFGNFIGAPLFNWALIKEGGYKFGNRSETISSVLGKNNRDVTLTRLGKSLCWLINKMDKNHCENSIMEDVSNTRK
jgi:hypothetical protein